MSLPGLQLAEPTVEAQAPPQPPVQLSLPKESEWRFEVAFGQTIRVKLLAGTAELFGTELASSQTYTLSGTKAAIFTWHGCKLEVSSGELLPVGGIGRVPAPPGPGSGGCQVEYTAEETPMAEYANVHFALEAMRQDAQAAGREGPRVLIVGPQDAGKTSLTKILTAYATKMGRQPIVVNLDPTEGMLSVPGSMTATVFRSMIDVEEGWGSSPMSGPSPVPVKLPLVYFHGLPSPLDADGSLFKPIVSRLALAVTGRFAEDKDTREAGVIIDTPGIISHGKGCSDEIIHHVVTEFSVSTILVLGSERLYSSMAKSYDNKPIATSAAAASNDRIAVVKLTKSGGTVSRDASFMKSIREVQIRGYFFGNQAPSTAYSSLSLSAGLSSTTITLSPHTQQVDFDSLSIYGITATTEGDEDDYDPSSFSLNESFLPSGINDRDTAPQPQQASTTSTFHSGLDSSGSVNPGRPSSSQAAIPLRRLLPSSEVPPPLALENTTLAITTVAPNAPLNEIRDASIMGFLYIVDVDQNRAKLRVLSPVAGTVPSRAMIWGGKWPGEVIGLVG